MYSRHTMETSGATVERNTGEEETAGGGTLTVEVQGVLLTLAGQGDGGHVGGHGHPSWHRLTNRQELSRQADGTVFGVLSDAQPQIHLKLGEDLSHRATRGLNTHTQTHKHTHSVI